MIEYSSNHSDATGILWLYSKDEATNFNADIGNNIVSTSLEYKTALVGEAEAQPAPNNNSGILKNATIVEPVKYLSNIWRLPETPLIKCKVELKLK